MNDRVRSCGVSVPPSDSRRLDNQSTRPTRPGLTVGQGTRGATSTRNSPHTAIGPFAASAKKANSNSCCGLFGTIRMACNTLSETVVRKIFDQDKRIQFCAVVDEKGEIEAGGIRPGAQSLEPAAETAKIAARMFLVRAIDQATSPYLGRPRWAIIQREKLIQILFPLPGSKQLQVTTTLDYPVL